MKKLAWLQDAGKGWYIQQEINRVLSWSVLSKTQQNRLN